MKRVVNLVRVIATGSAAGLYVLALTMGAATPTTPDDNNVQIGSVR